MILEVSHLTKKFSSPQGEFTAVDNISFSIGDGEIVGLLGPNGAGKTTTIFMIMDVLTPTSGEIKYFGLPLKNNREEIMSQINFSSTYIDLPWRLTIYQNLEILARLYGVKKREERIEKVLKLFELENLQHHRSGTLSAGEKTKAFLAKAFINFPKLLLLDEPTASLDPDIAAKVRQLLLDEREKYHTSMLFTSHNMAEVEEVCDRVIFINHGKIIAEDTPRHLAQKTKRSRVRLLILDGLTKLQQLCRRHHWQHKILNNHIEIEIEEKFIAGILQTIAKEKITFSEISIEKPTLEDYFLHASQYVSEKN